MDTGTFTSHAELCDAMFDVPVLVHAQFHALLVLLLEVLPSGTQLNAGKARRGSI